MSDSQTALASRAVFLSYASQDAEAARRICAALRAAGVEVWFDQSELVGGDSWDTKIKRQIQSCALFVPVISANAQQREEGYFRREWNLAANRTLDMAHDKAFLLPVVIDATSDAAAKVPDKFREVQWTRLPNGEASAAFVARVQKLLAGPGAQAATAAPVASRPVTASASPVASTRADTAFPKWLVAALSVAVLALAAYIGLRPSAKESVAPLTPAVVETKALPAAPKAAVASDKSIAVLPFANMSDDKANAFFADGIHEDILTNLANVGQLKVISRTSVIQYRDGKKPLRQIGEELGVAYVLEGSVRREGNQVRVTGQLINARTDEHLWAKSYDRELKDIFAIQSELAAEIAGALRAVISPGEKARIDTHPTDNVAAYESYLRGREIIRGTNSTLDMVERAQPLLEKAVQLDPNFAMAWAELGLLESRIYSSSNRTEAQLGKARELILHAVKLAPDALPVLRAQQQFFLNSGEEEKMAATVARITQLYPNRAETLVSQASLAWAQKSWREALDLFQRAVALDPRGEDTLQSRINLLFNLRHFDEVEAANRRLAEIHPLSFSQQFQRATLAFYARGETAPTDRLLATLPTGAERTDPNAVWPRARWLFDTGDAAGVIKLWRDSGPNWRFSTVVTSRFDLISVAASFLKLGDRAHAIPLLEKNRDRLLGQLAGEPDNIVKWCDLSLIYAMLGEQAEAQRILGKAQRLFALGRDGTKTIGNDADFAQTHAWLGDKSAAFEILAKALRQPGLPNYANVHALERGVVWWPLQGDPRLDALVKDPLNNAPLF